MNPKIKASALEKMQGKRPDELVAFTLRTNTVLTEEMDLLTAWGGKLLYDNGMTAVVCIPVERVNDLAEWEIVYDIM
jgi:hypothetical protein